MTDEDEIRHRGPPGAGKRRPTRPVKQVYGYPLVKDFRQRLQAVR